MKFNRENYEAFVLDWLEGKLSGHDKDLFRKFLDENPDIYSEIKEFSEVRLKHSTIIFPDKSILRKNVSLPGFNSEFENLCIAFLEGDLDSAEKQKFESLLSENPDKLIEYELFRKARLKADTNIIFSAKSKLKRLTVYQKRIRIFSAVSAAAVIVFVIIFVRTTQLMNHDLISGSDTNVTIPIKTDITDEKVVPDINISRVAENTLNKKEQELNSDSESKDKFTPVNKYNDLVYNVSDSYRGLDELEPVSSKFAKVENNHSVHFDKLRGTKLESVNNFDSYLTLEEFASNKILGSLFPENELLRQKRISMWDMASTGFEELNQISDGGFALNKEENQDGKLKRISVETPLFGISIPLKNRQPQ